MPPGISTWLWVICQEDIYHPQNSDIYHPQIRTFPTPQKKHLPGGQLPPPIFFLFLAHFSWLFRLTAHGGHQGWEGGGAWWGGHGAHQVEGAWRGGHGAHQVGGGYHGGHGGRHGGGKVGWALCFCSWRLGSHISKEGGEGELSPFQTKSAKSYLMLPNVFGLCALAFDIYVRITLSRFEQWCVKSESPHIKSKSLQKPFFSKNGYKRK